jgi:hypothetical protein
MLTNTNEIPTFDNALASGFIRGLKRAGYFVTQVQGD